MENFHLWVWVKNDISEAVQQAVCHISTNPGSWKCKMSSSIDPAQNFFRGDRWSTIWRSEAKIPRFLQKSAPPVANGAGSPSIGKIASKLTSNHEGLSFGLAKKKTLTGVTKIFGISQNQILKIFQADFQNCGTSSLFCSFPKFLEMKSQNRNFEMPK